MEGLIRQAADADENPADFCGKSVQNGAMYAILKKYKLMKEHDWSPQKFSLSKSVMSDQ